MLEALKLTVSSMISTDLKPMCARKGHPIKYQVKNLHCKFAVVTEILGVFQITGNVGSKGSQLTRPLP